jgi:hypothetical protein
MSEQHFACPCCGHYTLDEEPTGTYLICEVCRWEDDPVQFEEHDFEGGANGPSLNQAREFFRILGVSSPQLKGRGRSPRPEEMLPLVV